MSGAPTWYYAGQLLLTAFLGAAAAVIAYMQWRTSHLKVVVELFDHRVELINEVDRAIDRYSDNKEFDERIWEAYTKSRYLFSLEVSNMIKDIVSEMGDEMGKPEGDRKSWRYFFAKVQTVREAALPFLKLDQKIVPTPGQFFATLDARRKSFGDPPKPKPPEGGSAT